MGEEAPAAITVAPATLSRTRLRSHRTLSAGTKYSSHTMWNP